MIPAVPSAHPNARIIQEMSSLSEHSPLPKLGILAGGGALPSLLTQACESEGRPYFVLGFQGAIDPENCHATVRLGAVGEALSILRNEGVSDIVLAGRLKRPSIASIRPDAAAAKLLARIGGAFFSGDNSLLASVVDYLEEQGFKVLGVQDILNSLLAPNGLLGRISPSKDAKADIIAGMKIAHAVGALDIGQSIILQQGYVLAVEAAEGTDALIARCVELKRDIPHGGVLIKVKKPHQERRADLPTIGVTTIENIAQAGLAGIAVEAGGTLVIDKKNVAETADRLGVFVMGVTPQE